MSDDNERSFASAGSVSAGPVAWMIECIPGASSFTDMRHVAMRWPQDEVVPLYRQPTLTETERLAIEWAAVIAKEQSQVAVHKTLRALLEQTKRTTQWSDDSK